MPMLCAVELIANVRMRAAYSSSLMTFNDAMTDLATGRIDYAVFGGASGTFGPHTCIAFLRRMSPEVRARLCPLPRSCRMSGDCLCWSNLHATLLAASPNCQCTSALMIPSCRSDSIGTFASRAAA